MRKTRTKWFIGLAASFAVLGCAIFFRGETNQPVVVQYGEVLADTNDVRTVLRIVSHERWAALYRAALRRDVRWFRESSRQLAFGRPRQVADDWFIGSPGATVVYEDIKDKSRSFRYGLHYTNGCWTFVGYEYCYSKFY
jgi:hypothetical protein